MRGKETRINMAMFISLIDIERISGRNWISLETKLEAYILYNSTLNRASLAVRADPAVYSCAGSHVYSCTST